MKAFLDAVLDTARPALFLDFDGTLAPLEPRPEGVRLPPARRHLLRRLAARLPLAVISGRSLDDLAARLDVEGLTWAGNHGLEIRTGQTVWTHPAATRARSRLRTALGRIAVGLPAIPSAFLEDKGATASIHFRMSPVGSGMKVDHLVRKSLAGLESWLEARPGKKIWEIHPRVEWDKGAAVGRILSGLKPGTTPIYIGDDRTDEDAFLVLAGKGPTARVGGRGPTAARFRLASVDEVWAFLRALAENQEGSKEVFIDYNPPMDAVLTPDARLALTSAAAASKGSLPAGFLTGHIRGGRFIVEGFVAADAAALADPDAFFALDALQPGRIIGFVVPGVAAAARKSLLRPHAVGRLVLAIRKRPGTRNPDFVGWSVDFDGRFRFEPTPIVEDFADQVSSKSNKRMP